MLTTILSFAFVLGILIFVHELGHFLTAKMVGIRVERFSLGFPPRMFGKQIGDTDYCISWLPLGGYVKMSGMIDESLDGTIKGEPWEFASKPVWQRIIVICAGSFMNIVTAIAIYSTIVYFTGIAEIVGTSEVGALLPGKPAEGIGLRPGDVITSVENQPVQTWEELTKIISGKPDQELEISWIRDGQTFTKKVTPELQPQENIGLIGISAKVQYRKVGFFASVGQGFTTSYFILSQIAKALKVIVTGEQSFKDAVGGPIIIAKMAGESARLGFQALLIFTAFISLNSMCVCLSHCVSASVLCVYL